jgi:ABC-type sugar transport system permease subunit
LGLFFLVPLGIAAYRSLYKWDMLTPPTYVGLQNYAQLISSGALVKALGTTLSFSVIVVLGSSIFGLALAIALNRPGKFVAFVRASIFSAYVVSWVSVALLFTWMLDADGGIIGRFFKYVGVAPSGLLTSPNTALYALAGVTVWKITGYAMVVFLTGLQDIPKELYEAAALDGASAWHRFTNVTWPLLRPTTAFVVTTGLIVSFQAFDVVRVMTQGGPANATNVFVYAIYEQIFMNLRVGRASAMVVCFFVVLIGLTALQLLAFRTERSERS